MRQKNNGMGQQSAEQVFWDKQTPALLWEDFLNLGVDKGSRRDVEEDKGVILCKSGNFLCRWRSLGKETNVFAEEADWKEHSQTKGILELFQIALFQLPAILRQKENYV